MLKPRVFRRSGASVPTQSDLANFKADTDLRDTHVQKSWSLSLHCYRLRRAESAQPQTTAFQNCHKMSVQGRAPRHIRLRDQSWAECFKGDFKLQKQNTQRGDIRRLCAPYTFPTIVIHTYNQTRNTLRHLVAGIPPAPLKGLLALEFLLRICLVPLNAFDLGKGTNKTFTTTNIFNFSNIKHQCRWRCNFETTTPVT